MNSKPTPESVKRMIEQLPPDSLASILNFTVMECIKKNAFKNKPIAPIVASIEKTFGG
jgi:hypothetical protein